MKIVKGISRVHRVNDEVVFSSPYMEANQFTQWQYVNNNYRVHCHTEKVLYRVLGSYKDPIWVYCNDFHPAAEHLSERAVDFYDTDRNKLEPEFLLGIIYIQAEQLNEHRTMGLVYNYPEYSLCSVLALDGGSFTSKHDGLSYPNLVSDGVDFWLSYVTNQLIHGEEVELTILEKLNSDLTPQWQTELPGYEIWCTTFSYPRTSIVDDSIVIANKINGGDKVADQYWIYLLNKHTGDIVWSRQMPENLASVKDAGKNRLIACCDNQLYVMDLRTGDIVHQWQTDHSNTLGSLDLCVHNECLIVIKQNAAEVLIYSTESWQLLRRQLMPEDRRDLPFLAAPIAHKGIVYIILGDALLIIDTNDVDAPLEAEQDPAEHVKLPSKADGKIELHFSGMDKDRFLRLGVRQALSLLSHHSREMGTVGTRQFNGHVHMIIRDMATPVNDMLPVLKQMMINCAKYVRERRSVCGKRKQTCWVTYEYYEKGELIDAQYDRIILPKAAEQAPANTESLEYQLKEWCGFMDVNEVEWEEDDYQTWHRMATQAYEQENSAYAALQLGLQQFFDDKPSQNAAVATAYFLEAANAGYAEAMWQLIERSELGQSEQQRYVWFKLASLMNVGEKEVYGLSDATFALSDAEKSQTETEIEAIKAGFTQFWSRGLESQHVGQVLS